MNRIVQNFDCAAEGYAAHSATQADLAAALARWIAPEERRGRAVEFGAGTGLFTRQMLPWDGTYQATDAAPRMVAHGRVLCPSADWKQRDASKPEALGPVDWIFACNLLQWLDEPEEILRNWRKILAHGGQLAVAILSRGTLDELLTVLPEATPLQWRSADEWRTVVANAGFTLERAEMWEQIEIHPNALDFLRSLHAMGLAPRTMIGPGRLRTALRAYEQNFRANGGVRATWQAWLARAVAA